MKKKILFNKKPWKFRKPRGLYFFPFRMSGFVFTFITLLRSTAEQVLKSQWCLVCTICYTYAKNTSISEYSCQQRIVCHLLFNTFHYVQCLFPVCSANRRVDWICMMQLLVIKVGQIFLLQFRKTFEIYESVTIHIINFSTGGR